MTDRTEAVAAAYADGYAKGAAWERAACGEVVETVPNKHMNATKEFIAAAIRERSDAT
jgi:hypothetical protein